MDPYLGGYAPDRRPLASAALLWSFILLTCAACATTAVGQDDRFGRDARYREAKRIDVDDRGLVDELRSNRAFETDTRGAGGLNANIDVSRIDAAAVRRSVGQIATVAKELYAILAAEERRTPTVGRYLADVIQIRGDAEYLQSVLRADADVARRVTTITDLNQSWRLLSQRLGNVAGLSRPAAREIGAMDAAVADLEKGLSVTASLDRRQLIRTADMLAESLDRLESDIEFEMPRDTKTRELVYNVQQARQHVIHLTDMAYENAARPRLLDEYDQYSRVWSPVAVSLRAQPSRYLERGVRRIQSANRDVTDLLLIDREVDGEQLKYLAADLQRDIENFYQKTTLAVLRDLPQSEYALSTADAFWGTFENFIWNVNNEKDRAEWVSAFNDIQNEWVNFNGIYQNASSNDARAALANIRAGLETLSESLAVEERFDRDRTANLAGSIEAYAGSISRDTQTWLSRENPVYRTEALAQVIDFEQQARRFHELVLNGAEMRDLRPASERLFDQWKKVYNYIIRCEGTERPYLAASARRTTPAFVELRTTLAN